MLCYVTSLTNDRSVVTAESRNETQAIRCWKYTTL